MAERVGCTRVVAVAHEFDAVVLERGCVRQPRGPPAKSSAASASRTGRRRGGRAPERRRRDGTDAGIAATPLRRPRPPMRQLVVSRVPRDPHELGWSAVSTMSIGSMETSPSSPSSASRARALAASPAAIVWSASSHAACRRNSGRRCASAPSASRPRLRARWPSPMWIATRPSATIAAASSTFTDERRGISARTRRRESRPRRGRGPPATGTGQGIAATTSQPTVDDRVRRPQAIGGDLVGGIELVDGRSNSACNRSRQLHVLVVTVRTREPRRLVAVRPGTFRPCTQAEPSR